MKVKIKDLKPNPYRSIDTYPVDEPKVLTLMDSIKQTGFWDNILARQYNGEIQIAYGHHRLEALRRLMDPENEVEIPVKDLDDATMIKIMANENMGDWATTPTVIDQTVKVTKEFLLSHPEIALKYGQVHKYSSTDENIIGAIIIAKFLGWKQQTISDSLTRLKMIDNGEATQLTFSWFNTEGSARTFVGMINEQKESGTPIPKEMHETIAKKYRESGNSTKVLKETVREVVHGELESKEPKDELISEFAGEVTQLIEGIKWLEDALKNFESRYKKNEVPDQWVNQNWHQIMMDNLLRILVQIDSFIKTYKTQPSVVH